MKKTDVKYSTYVKTLKEVLASASKEKVHVYTNATVTKNFDGQNLYVKCEE